MQSNRVTEFAYSLMCLGSDARLAVADPIAPGVFASFVTFPVVGIAAAKVVSFLLESVAPFLANSLVRHGVGGDTAVDQSQQGHGPHGGGAAGTRHICAIWKTRCNRGSAQ